MRAAGLLVVILGTLGMMACGNDDSSESRERDGSDAGPDESGGSGGVVPQTVSCEPSSGTVYHVSPAGDDEAAGTAEAPWRTVARGVTALSAGDTLYIGEGVYEEPVIVTRSGTELIDKTSSPVSEEIPEKEKWQYIMQVKDGCLSGLLRCLSLQQRLTFILNVLLDLPLEDVASVIDKSVNATRILVHRSRQNIKNFLCKNCSLYDARNPCRCENLINFSLKQNWIGLPDTSNALEQAEKEIKSLKSVVGLYKTLSEITPGNGLDKYIQQTLADKKDFLIFHDKKVK